MSLILETTSKTIKIELTKEELQAICLCLGSSMGEPRFGKHTMSQLYSDLYDIYKEEYDGEDVNDHPPFEVENYNIYNV